MNVLAELKAFHESIAVNQLSAGQIALWYALWQINNKCAWQDWFSVPIRTLCLYTGQTAKSVYNNRQQLYQKGYLAFEKSAHQSKSSRYRLHHFTDPSTDLTTDLTTEVTTDPITDPSTEVTTDLTTTLKRQDKTKPNPPPLEPPQGGGGAGKAVCKRPSKYPPVTEQIAQYSPDEALREALAAFVEMRQGAKKPVTAYGFHCLLRDLDRLGATAAERLAVVNGAVSRGWQGFYALDRQQPGRTQGGKQEAAPSEYSGVYQQFILAPEEEE